MNEATIKFSFDIYAKKDEVRLEFNIREQGVGYYGIGIINRHRPERLSVISSAFPQIFHNCIYLRGNNKIYDKKSSNLSFQNVLECVKYLDKAIMSLGEASDYTSKRVWKGSSWIRG